MINRNNKKGFTIVELVIVIAVIAILAAVLIPTFAGIINKANMSADQQAVRQMNTLLASESASGKAPAKIQDVKTILDANGYNHKLDPLFKGYSFAWIAEKNVVVLVEDDKVVYPEEYVDYDFTKVELFNVAKVSSADDITNLANGTFADINGLNSIVLEKNMSVAPTSGNYLSFNNAGDIEIDGNGNTITTNIDVTSGTSLTLTDVTIDGSNYPDSSAVKPIAGNVYMSDATLISPNGFGLAQKAVKGLNGVECKIENSTFDAPYALYIIDGNWTFENCKFIGTVTIGGCAKVTFNNCTFTAKAASDTTAEIDAGFNYAGGAVFNEYAVVVIDGRDEAYWGSGTVAFTNCTVTNQSGAEFEGVAYHTQTEKTVENPNKITVTWNGAAVEAH